MQEDMWPAHSLCQASSKTNTIAVALKAIWCCGMIMKQLDVA